MSSVMAIVPAAGASRRMGHDKLLLPWGDSVVLDAVLSALQDGGVERLVVVTAPDSSDLAPWVRGPGRDAVVNPAPARGMLSSIQVGLSALGGPDALGLQGSPLLVCPGDLPGIDALTVRRLIDAIEAGAVLAVPVSTGRRGHPLAISPSLVSEIEGLDPRRGLRQLVDRHRDELVEIAAPPEVLRDLDTPEDYAAALRGRD